MNVIRFLAGFLYTLFENFWHVIPMAIDAGSVCIKKKIYPWDVDEGKFLEWLEKESEGRDL